MRILVFGDSITHGFWDTEGGWVERLRRHYYAQQVQDLVKNLPSVFNLGIDGDTSHDILQRIEPETQARTWKGNKPAVVVQIGANDSFQTGQGVAKTAPKDYQQNLRAIIQKAKPLSTQMVFIGLAACNQTLTTPVAWGDFYYTNQRLKKYEQTMHEVAQAHNIPFIPIFDTFLEKVKTNASLLPDGIHPNNAGHQLLFEIIQPQLAALIKTASNSSQQQ